MTTALVVDGSAPQVVDLAADLAAVGIHVLGAVARDSLVREASQHAPDLVVCHDVSPDDTLFDAFARLAETVPSPVVVFTHDPEVAKIDRAMASGVHAYVVNGYGQHRLRGVLHVARARFQEEARLRGELADVTRRFDERKLVDRAKGILMRARQLSEAEAFAVLRAASMHSNRRVGQVSQQVIAAAHYADAVNRAGKLRMLSQRLVKASALCVATGESAAQAQVESTRDLIETSIASLGKSLSQPTFGDLLEEVAAAWDTLRSLLAEPPVAAGRLGELDGLAEQLLHCADRLTRQLETVGLVTTLHILNVSGRQRMLSQRYAKQALLGVLLESHGIGPAREELQGIAATFEEGVARLRAAPLTTAEIRDLLARADGAWGELTRAARRVTTAAGASAVDEASEALVALFEELTDRYERSMQVLMG